MRLPTAPTALTLAALLCGTAAAQSTVRPVPRVPLPLDWEAGGAGADAEPRTLPTTRYERLAGLAGADSPEQRVEVDAYGRYLSGAMLETGGGDVQTARFGWRAALLRELAGGSTLALEVENEMAFYDFGLSAPLVGTDTDPFNDLYRLRVAGTYYGPLTDRLSYFHGLDLTLAGEPEAGLEQSTTFGVTSGLAYRATEDLELTAGLFAFSRLEDDAVLVPWIGLAWRVAPGVELTAEGNRVALSADLTERVDVELYAVYDQRQFRLEDTGGVDAPAFRDEQIDLGATFGLALGEGLRVELGAGYTAWRELTTLADGAVIDEVELDPEPFVTLGLSIAL